MTQDKILYKIGKRKNDFYFKRFHESVPQTTSSYEELLNRFIERVIKEKFFVRVEYIEHDDNSASGLTSEQKKLTDTLVDLINSSKSLL